MRFFHNSLCILCLGTALGLLSGCRQAVPPGAVECPFSLTIDAPEATKSILGGPDIETRFTGVCIALYNEEGMLETSAYFQDPSQIRFSLQPGKYYGLYALANCGNCTSLFPRYRAQVNYLTYKVPAYVGGTASIQSTGIPMSGSLSYLAGGSGSSTIRLTRLFCKVTVSLSCDWGGARIQSARVCQMNGKLVPFRSSTASSSSDMLDFEELEEIQGSGSGTFSAVFYVPENRQGSYSISDSEDKAPDKNTTLKNREAYLTYLEVEVASSGKYDGTIVYRSYLGANATSDLDLIRNCQYYWTIHYKSAVVDDFESVWKHDFEDLEITDYSLVLSPSPNTVIKDATFRYSVQLRRQVLKPSLSQSSTPLDAAFCSWSSSNPAIASIDASGMVTAHAPGQVTIRATHTPSWPDSHTLSATAGVTVIAWQDGWDDDDEETEL